MRWERLNGTWQTTPRNHEIRLDDLCKKADSISSPPRHEKVLNDREKAISNGEDVFVDLHTARKNIENSLYF